VAPIPVASLAVAGVDEGEYLEGDIDKIVHTDCAQLNDLG